MGWLRDAVNNVGRGIGDAGARLDDAVRQTGAATEDIIRGEDAWDDLTNGWWEASWSLLAPGALETGNQIMDWLLPDPDAAAAAINGTQLNRDGKIQHIPVVYGQCRVGGARVLQQTSGASNEFLHIIIVLSEGRIEAVDNIYVDDKLITDASISSLVRARTYLGGGGQAADADLIAELPALWTTAHRLRGVAYVYLRLQWSHGVWSGNPRITCDVRGKRMYDPRSTAFVYSNNAALCVRDYLTNTHYGRGVPASALDEQSWSDAADYCDTQRTPYTGAPVQALWACDGVVDTGNRVLDNLRQLASCCAGSVVYTAGRWSMVLARASDSVLTLTEQHIIGGIKYANKGKGDRLNSIRATWANPAIDDKADEIVLSDATYLAADNGLTLERSLSLPYTRNAYRAQDLCEIALRQSRLGLAISFRATLAALPIAPGDVFSLSYASLGWSGKLFRATTAKLHRNATISIAAVEYDAAVYSFAPRSQITFAAPTSLPDASVCPAPTALTLASGSDHLLRLGDGTIISRIYASWSAPTGYPFITGYEVEMKLSSASIWLPVAILAGITSTGCYVPQVQDASAYDVRVRAVTGAGVPSPWAAATNHTVIGKTAAPTSISALTATTVENGVRLTWTNPTDADLDHVRVFAAATNDRTSAAEIGRVYGNTLTHPLTAGTIRYYWALAVDTSGNPSGHFPLSQTGGIMGTAGSVVWAQVADRPTSVATLNAADGRVLSTITAEFSESWDDVDALSNWENVSGSGELSIVTDSAALFGGKALKVGNNLGVDQAWLYHRRLIPFDPRRMYVLRIRVRQAAGTGTVWLGWGGVAADGVTWVNASGAATSGSQHYHAATGANPGATYTEYVGYTSGYGASVGTGAVGTLQSPGKMHPNVRYLRPCVVVNYDSQTGEAYVDSFIVESYPLYADGTTLDALKPAQAGATAGADWNSNVSNKPSIFRAVACGYSATTHPAIAGIYTESNSAINNGGRSYSVSVYNRATGVWDSHTSYDVYGAASNAATMAAALNALTANKIVVIVTNDEPKLNRLTNGLPDAIYRCGGSAAIFGSANFKSRSAYILIGIPGIGEGNGLELYAGDIDADPDAWVETSITIKNGNVQLGGISARNAVDISYTDGTTIESLKPAQAGATLGADFKTNVTNIPHATIYNNDDAVALGFNPTFSDWTGACPAGWSFWSVAVPPTKETTNVRVGQFAVRYISPGTNELGMMRTVSMAESPLPIGTFLSGTIDIHLESVVTGLPGMLVRLYTNSALTTWTDARVQPSNVTGAWQRVPWTARVGSSQQIYCIQIYIMAAWTGFPGATNFNGTVIFDNLRFALFDSSVDNKTITITNNGTLTGGGGGQVTITGLGYTGALNATRNVIYRQGGTVPTGQSGDIWYVTATTTGYTVDGLYRHSGSAWELVGNGYTNTNQLTDGAGLGQTAVWSSVTGTGKPADNATRNVIYRQGGTVPTGQSGDIWYVTATTTGYTVDGLYRHSGSAWELVGNGYTNTNQLTDGAGLGQTAVWSSVTGTGKPANNADVTQDAINAGVTTTGYLVLATGGHIRSGKTSYADDTNAGFWQGNDGGVHKIKMGNAGQRSGFEFDGTDFVFGTETRLRGGDTISSRTYYYSTQFDSVDGFVQTVANGGTVGGQPAYGAATLNVTSTAGSSAQIMRNIGWGDWRQGRYKNRRRTSKLMVYSTVDADQYNAWYIITGAPNSTSITTDPLTSNGDFFGFQWDAETKTLYAVSKSSFAGVYTRIAFPSFTYYASVPLELIVEYKPGASVNGNEGEAVFTVYDALSSKTTSVTINTNLPYHSDTNFGAALFARVTRRTAMASTVALTAFRVAIEE